MPFCPSDSSLILQHWPPEPVCPIAIKCPPCLPGLNKCLAHTGRIHPSKYVNSPLPGSTRQHFQQPRAFSWQFLSLGNLSPSGDTVCPEAHVPSLEMQKSRSKMSPETLLIVKSCCWGLTSQARRNERSQAGWTTRQLAFHRARRALETLHTGARGTRDN